MAVRCIGRSISYMLTHQVLLTLRSYEGTHTSRIHGKKTVMCFLIVLVTDELFHNSLQLRLVWQWSEPSTSMRHKSNSLSRSKILHHLITKLMCLRWSYWLMAEVMIWSCKVWLRTLACMPKSKIPLLDALAFVPTVFFSTTRIQYVNCSDSADSF